MPNRYWRATPITAISFGLLLSLSLIATGTAFADTAPAPKQKVTLEDMTSRLKEESDRKKTLQKDIEKENTALESLQKDILQTTRLIKEKENSLINLENDIAELEEEENALALSIEKDRHAMSDLIIALRRLQSVPPEAVLLQPEKPFEIAQAKSLLNSILPDLYKRVERFKTQINQLNKTKEELNTKKTTLLSTLESYESKQKEMDRLLKKRQSRFASLQKDFDQTQKEIEKISKSAENLKELVQDIERYNKRQEARKLSRLAIDNIQKGRKTERDKKSEKRTAKRRNNASDFAQIPVSGVITVAFGARDEIGAKSQGLEIRGRRSGIVVAPLPGKIMFAGAFKGYGNLVIIDHGDNYHSLLAKLGHISVEVGQNIQLGEPIGKMQSQGNSGLGSAPPSLYYELRFKGKPVDPATKFPDLS